MKKQFTVPLVFLAAAQPAGTGFGSLEGGSEQDRIRPVPMSFGEWAQTRWVADYDENPGVDFQDYAKWWSQSGLGETAWAQFNPGAALDTETK